jgi:hypothetical protein
LLSSAILYVAIVAIWAGVLIPRWLRRDSSATAAARAAAAEAEAEAAASASALASALASDEDSVDAGVGEEPVPRSAPWRPVSWRRYEEAPRYRQPGGDEDLEPVVSDPGHRRVVSARRRLLMMLLALTIASGVLAGTRMAAWWVIVPPSVMLLGYLLLLRAAAKADAERRSVRVGPVAHLAHVAPVAVGPVAATRVAPAATMAPPAPMAPPAKIIAFLPPQESAQEPIYDQYADAKLRAVGD